MSHPQRRPKATTLAMKAKKAGMSQSLLRAIQDGSVTPTQSERNKLGIPTPPGPCGCCDSLFRMAIWDGAACYFQCEDCKQSTPRYATYEDALQHWNSGELP